MKWPVRYEVVRVLQTPEGQTWTLPHASARTEHEARQIAKRELDSWIIVERRVVDASDQPEKF